MVKKREVNTKDETSILVGVKRPSKSDMPSEEVVKTQKVKEDLLPPVLLELKSDINSKEEPKEQSLCPQSPIKSLKAPILPT